MWAGYWLGVVAYAVAWLRGGPPERFAAMVLLVITVILTMNFILTWEIGGNYLIGRIMNGFRLLIFVWLCLRSNRWWPFPMTAAMALMALVDVIGLIDPAISSRDAASAKIGLGYLVDLTLLFSVGERMLAGEPPAARAAWARADLATAARRDRRKARQLETTGDRLRKEGTDGS